MNVLKFHKECCIAFGSIGTCTINLNKESYSFLAEQTL